MHLSISTSHRSTTAVVTGNRRPTVTTSQQQPKYSSSMSLITPPLSSSSYHGITPSSYNNNSLEKPSTNTAPQAITSMRSLPRATADNDTFATLYPYVTNSHSHNLSLLTPDSSMAIRPHPQQQQQQQQQLKKGGIINSPSSKAY